MNVEGYSVYISYLAIQGEVSILRFTSLTVSLLTKQTINIHSYWTFSDIEMNKIENLYHEITQKLESGLLFTYSYEYQFGSDNAADNCASSALGLF